MIAKRRKRRAISRAREETGSLNSAGWFRPRFQNHAEETVNEYFCMNLARKCGVAVMPCDILSYNGVEAFMTERFDCAVFPDGRVIRLEQKDFCQLAGKSSDEKYFRGLSGFSNQDLASILDGLSFSETWKFLSGSMFSLIIGNSDDHGKNYSILYEKGGNPVLAPFYDLASISGMMMFHPETTGSSRLARPIGKAWFAADINVYDMKAHAGLLKADFGQFAAMFGQLVNDVKSNSPIVNPHSP